jgi:hypothetical protein
LRAAYLCADCEFIDVNSWRCAKCAGCSLYPLQKLLDRLPATPADAAVSALEFDILDATMRRR